MAFQYQPQNFDFIAQAGQTIQKFGDAYNLAKKMKLDDTQAQQAHELLLDQAKTKYKKATGVDDEVKATAFAARYFPPKYQNETAIEAVQRWEKADSLFKKALETKSVEILQQKSQGTPAVSEKPGEAVDLAARRAPTSVRTPSTSPVTMKPVFSPENARSARLAGSSLPTGMITGGEYPGDEPQGSQMPPTPAQPAMPADAVTLRAEAERMGLFGNKDAESILNRVSNQNFNLPEGTRAAAMTKQLQTQGGWTPEQKTALEAVPTDKDLMTNERLSKQEEQRNRLRAALAAMQEARLKRSDLKKEDYALLDAQIKLLNTQIKASEAMTKTALGIPTGKDILGQTTYFTGEEADRLQADNESTYLSAVDLLTRVNTKGASIIPPTPPRPLGSIPEIKTEQEYNALPGGTEYIGPDGKRRRKK